jgi:nicotinamidase-related amidase
MSIPFQADSPLVSLGKWAAEQKQQQQKQRWQQHRRTGSAGANMDDGSVLQALAAGTGLVPGLDRPDAFNPTKRPSLVLPPSK